MDSWARDEIGAIVVHTMVDGDNRIDGLNRSEMDITSCVD